MVPDLSAAPLSEPVVSRSWFRVWWQGLTRPSLASYSELAADPRATRKRAYSAIFNASVVAAAAGSLATPAVGPVEQLATVCLGSVFVGFLALLAFALGTTISHLIARAVGGRGSYDQLTYVTAAYVAPLTVLLALASLIPYGGLLGIAFGVYQLGLLVVAVKAVHGLSWARAAIPSIFWLGLAVALFIGGVALVLLSGGQFQADPSLLGSASRLGA